MLQTKRKQYPNIPHQTTITINEHQLSKFNSAIINNVFSEQHMFAWHNRLQHFLVVEV